MIKRKTRANEPMRITPPVPFHRGMDENGRAAVGECRAETLHGALAKAYGT